MAADPVAISAPPQFKVASVVWRHAGKLYVTAIAKQTVVLQPDGASRPTGPAAIGREERDDGAGRLQPDDIAPCVARGDLWVFGHVAAPAGAFVAVTLRLLRDGAPLLEKRASLPVGDKGQAFLGGLGPVSKRWPARARRLGGISPSLLEGSVLAVPEKIDWGYFQAAPVDQQVPWIQPRDTVRLDVACASDGQVAKYEVGVPRDVPQAILAERDRDAQTFRLRPDTVSIDVDQLRAHVVYRGHTVLGGEPQLAKMIVRVDDELELALAGTVQSADGAYKPPATG